MVRGDGQPTREARQGDAMRASPVFLRLAVLLAVCGFPPAVANAADLIEVDLQLVLAADASGSMSRDEMRLQREGHIEALRDPDVINAIASGPIGRIAVTYVEWAGPRTQSVVVPWTVLTGRASVMAFTETLAAAPSRNSGSGTAVSSGLLFAAAQFEANGFRSYRRTIDISGDGVSDQGPPVAEARESVIARRIVINGLSIASEKPNRDGPYDYLFEDDDRDIHAYYRDEVIGGPGSFVIAVDRSESFAVALRRKLVLEIAAWAAASRPPL